MKSLTAVFALSIPSGKAEVDSDTRELVQDVEVAESKGIVAY